jgi:anti-sigma factor RsiW
MDFSIRNWSLTSEMPTHHMADDDLEAYSLGHLSAAASAPLEEHLLGCTGCIDRLAGWVEYVGAMRSAGHALRASSRARTAGSSLPD